MKILLFMALIFTLLEAKIVNLKQNFNKKIVEVKESNSSIQKIFYAHTSFDESRIVDLSLRFSGFVEDIYADKKFSYIQKGAPLFKIYSETLTDLKSKIDIAKQMNQRETLKALEKKLSLLDARGSISKDFTLDILSPISGVVLQKNINQGSFIKKGSLLYRIVDNSTMWVIFEAYQSDLSFLKERERCTVFIEGVGKFDSTIDYIYPYIDKKSQKIDIRVILNNPKKKIFANLFAKVTLFINRGTILTLPRSAVLTKGSKHFVFKPLKDGEFEPKEVKAKRIDSKTFQIISGLKKGDKVIDKALFMLDSDAITNALYDNDNDEDW